MYIGSTSAHLYSIKTAAPCHSYEERGYVCMYVVHSQYIRLGDIKNVGSSNCICTVCMPCTCTVFPRIEASLE